MSCGAFRAVVTFCAALAEAFSPPLQELLLVPLFLFCPPGAGVKFTALKFAFKLVPCVSFSVTEVSAVKSSFTLAIAALLPAVESPMTLAGKSGYFSMHSPWSWL